MKKKNNMEMIPIHQPQLPTSHQIIPYLKRIDKNRWYSNFGALLTEFETRLANHFFITKENIATASNGTFMLVAMLKALQVPENCLCIMPSWTFIATAAAAYYANLIPCFIDVDAHTQALDPVTLKEQLPSIQKPVGAVIVVAPFGRPINTKAWDKFTQETGIPVIIDAAASFDIIGKQITIGKSPIMVSLHATKIFGIGEGGLAVSSDANLIHKIKTVTSFGFNKDREAILLGSNAKLSEYAAAVGLAALDDWSRVRMEWKAVHDYYIEQFTKINIKHILSSDYLSSTCNIILPNKAKKVAQSLSICGIETRQWWLNGCHNHQAYKKFPKLDNLQNTEWLSESILGLPLSMDLKRDAIIYICKILEESLEKNFG